MAAANFSLFTIHFSLKMITFDPRSTYSRSRKPQIFLVFFSLIRNFAG